MKKEDGSMTIEAALIIPLFMTGILSLISFCMLLIFNAKVSLALNEEAHRLSLVCTDGLNIDPVSVSLGIKDRLRDDNANYSMIRNGENGLDFSKSKLNDREYLQLDVCYSFTPFGVGFFDFADIEVEQTCLIHVFCGYNKGMFFDDEEDYVYITQDSDVYHLNRQCSHIRLSITQVNASEIPSLRNSSGAKYHSCEICNSRIEDGRLYITEDGTRYHCDINCSGLVRRVKAVKKSEVLDRRPCRRCGN